ncbi:MAG: hypothetical protein AAFQ68_16230 [Bacteroidota bacterium]
MDTHTLKVIKFLTLSLLLLLAIVGYCGAFVNNTYRLDAATMIPIWQGKDMVHLLIMLPLMGFSLRQMHRQRSGWMLLFGGMIFTLLYHFFAYAFAVHFNDLFLLYCLILGLSFYLFVFFLRKVARIERERLFREDAPLRLIGGYLILVSLSLYVMALSEVIPALQNASPPDFLTENGLLTDPIQVLDLSIFLPSMLVAGILLIRQHTMGYLVSAVFLVFLLFRALSQLSSIGLAQQMQLPVQSWQLVYWDLIAIVSLGMFLRFAQRSVKSQS